VRDDNERPVPDVTLEPERYELHAAPPYRFDVDRREFFKVLGCGVVVLLLAESGWPRSPAGSAAAVEAGEARRAPRKSAPGCISARTE
jgi:hypothetical protein